MRIILQVYMCIIVSTPASGVCGQSTTEESERAKFRGRWEVVSRERRGIESKRRVGSKYEFFRDGTFQLTSSTGKVYPKRKYELHIDANPKQMDWSCKLITRDKKIEASTLSLIYRIDNNILLICSPILSSNPRPTAFSSKPDQELITLKRIPFAGAAEEQKRQEASDGRAKKAAFVYLGSVASPMFDGQYDVDFHKKWPRNISEKAWQAIWDLRDIRCLGFRGCTGVGDEQMKNVAKLTSIISLNLHSTEVSDAGLAHLVRLNNLKGFCLSFTSVSDEGLELIAKMPNIEKLALQGTAVTEKGLEKLRSARKDIEIDCPRMYTKSQQKAAAALSRLGLDIDEKLDWHTKAPLCRITSPPSLIVSGNVSEVKVEENPRIPTRTKVLDAAIVGGYFGKLPGPISVMLGGADDSTFSCLRDVDRLVHLHIVSPYITDAGVTELLRHKHLKVLNLPLSKKITDQGVASLASLKMLEKLNLIGITLSAEGLTSLLALENLKELKVSHIPANRDVIDKFKWKGVKVKYR